MNRIYKVIWSKIKNCYVVVSELAKRRSKGGQACCHSSAGSVLAAVLLASLLNMGVAAPVWAANSADITGAAGTAGSEDTLATIQGGEGITVTADPEDEKTIIVAADRTLALLNRYLVFSPDYGTSTTDNPVVDSRSTSSFALGQKAQINVIPGETTTSENNMAIGSNAKIFAGEAGKSKGSNTAIGAGSATGVIVDYDTGKIIYTTLSTAVGASARVYGNESVSIGQNAQVGYKKEIVLTSGGNPAYAVANDAIAIGSGTTTWSNESTAIGASAKAGTQYSGQSVSDPGKAENYTTSGATAVGFKATATNKYSSAIGSESSSTGQNSTAIGAKTSASGASSAALGASAKATGSSSTAVGTSAQATKTNSTAIGSNAKAIGENSSAIGALTVATGIQNVAMGEGSEARKDETISIGFHSVAANAEDISVGHDTVTFGDGSLAMGHMAFTGMPVKEKTGTDAQEKKFIELPTGSRIRESSKLYIQTSDGTVLEYNYNSNNNTVKYYKVEAVSTGDNWEFVRVKNSNNQDIEYLAKESTDKDVRTEGTKVKHIDYYYVKGENVNSTTTKTYPLDGGIAIGSYTVAQGERSMAFGLTSAAYGKNSIAQGLYADAYGEGAIAFGHETVSGAHVKIRQDANLNDMHTAEFTVSGAGITDRTLADGSVVGLDKNNAYTLDGNIKVSFTGAILTVDGESFGYDATKITLASTGVQVFRDEATGYYYYKDENDIAHQVGMDENLVFTGSGGKTATVTAGKMTLSSGGISVGSYAHAEGDKALAVGRVAGAYGRDSAAIGRFANAIGEDALAIGHNTSAGAEVDTDTLDEDTNTALLKLTDGSPVASGGTGGIAIGSYAHAAGDKAIAIGTGNIVTGDNSIAIGKGHTVSGKNSGAFGDPDTITGDGSYAIGNDNTIKVNDGFILGSNATVTATGGVALGKASVADKTKAGEAGFDVSTGSSYAGQGNDAPTWMSTQSAVSVGDLAKGITRRITSVAAGYNETDAVNVAQLKTARTEIKAGDNITVVTTYGDDGHVIYTFSSSPETVVAPGTNVTVDGPGTSTGSAGETGNTAAGAGAGTGTTDQGTYTTNTYTVNAKDTKYTLSDDGGVPGGKGKTTYTITLTDSDDEPAGKAVIVDTDTRNTVTAGDNITVKEDKNEDGSVNYTISAAKANNVKVINGEHTTVTEGQDGDFTTYAVNVKTGGKVAEGDTNIVTGGTIYNETRVQKDGNYIKKDNTAGENITVLDEKVKANETNIENINNEINNTNNRVTGLDNRMKKGLAGAAALAALHPMDFDPDDKLTFAAGVGNYRGENAAAIGAFYRPDEKVMFSLGGTVGNGENMVNAGISFSLDRVNRISNSRTAMAHEIVELRDHIAKQDARIAKQDEQIAKLTDLVNRLAGPGLQLKDTVMFPDVPENHWAYNYLEDLQKRGIIEGYPNGLFMGDRSMTRYEFAAMLDRALRKGIALDERAAREFGPELDYIREQSRIRVDRIAGQDTDRYKIERVRVNNEDKETRDIYGSKLPRQN